MTNRNIIIRLAYLWDDIPMQTTICALVWRVAIWFPLKMFFALGCTFIVGVVVWAFIKQPFAFLAVIGVLGALFLVDWLYDLATTRGFCCTIKIERK